LRACDFRDTVFENCSLRDAHLPECRFEGADLRNADLGGIKLTNAQLFKGALISKRQAADLLSQLGLKVL
jgi:fluoroquinolone resistance protein